MLYFKVVVLKLTNKREFELNKARLGIAIDGIQSCYIIKSLAVRMFSWQVPMRNMNNIRVGGKHELEDEESFTTNRKNIYERFNICSEKYTLNFQKVLKVNEITLQPIVKATYYCRATHTTSCYSHSKNNVWQKLC